MVAATKNVGCKYVCETNGVC